jgi:hypothetical protein
MLRTTLIATTAALALAAPAVAAAPAPKITSVSLETATDGVPKGTVAIYFRTDGAIPRKSGGGLDATAGLKKAQEASVATFRKSTRCYVAYTKAASLEQGEKSTVHIAIGGRDVKRTLTLKAEGNGKSIGC